MIKATNVQCQNFNRRFDVVKSLKKQETCSEQKKVAGRTESCSKSEKMLKSGRATYGHPYCKDVMTVPSHMV